MTEQILVATVIRICLVTHKNAADTYARSEMLLFQIISKIMYVGILYIEDGVVKVNSEPTSLLFLYLRYHNCNIHVYEFVLHNMGHLWKVVDEQILQERRWSQNMSVILYMYMLKQLIL